MCAVIERTKTSGSRELHIVESMEAFLTARAKMDEVVSSTCVRENAYLAYASAASAPSVLSASRVSPVSVAGGPTIGVIFDMDGTLTEPGHPRLQPRLNTHNTCTFSLVTLPSSLPPSIPSSSPSSLSSSLSSSLPPSIPSSHHTHPSHHPPPHITHTPLITHTHTPSSYHTSTFNANCLNQVPLILVKCINVRVLWQAPVTWSPWSMLSRTTHADKS